MFSITAISLYCQGRYGIVIQRTASTATSYAVGLTLPLVRSHWPTFVHV